MPPEKQEQKTERQKIEQDFHNQWAQQVNLDDLLVTQSFEAATALENNYALSQMLPLKGKKLLDLGCGAGETSVYFALQGAEVTAVDISEEMLELVKKLAARHNVTLQTQHTVAEQMPFADEAFDIVFGNGVLHHIELEPSLKEIHRVLKPGGRAVFIEPLCYNPVIEVYRHLAKTVRTPTERPFSYSNLNDMAKLFPKVEHREFWFFSLLVFIYFFLIERANPSKVRYWKKVIEDSERLEWFFLPLKRLDDTTLKVFPWLGCLCWNMVITATK